MRKSAGPQPARWEAKRHAVPALAAALGGEKVPRIREAIMTALMRVGNEASVGRCFPIFARRMPDNAPPRSKRFNLFPSAIVPFMPALLGDAEADVRLLATELARNMEANDATRVLCRLSKRVASQRMRRGH